MRDRQRLEILCDYAADKGYVVEFEPTEDEEMDPNARLITVNNATSLRTQVYGLLHEIGHTEQSLNYGRLFHAGAWGELENELDAWVRGWRIAETLGLGLPPAGYQQAARNSLKTYAHFCSVRPKKKVDAGPA